MASPAVQLALLVTPHAEDAWLSRHQAHFAWYLQVQEMRPVDVLCVFFVSPCLVAVCA